MSTDPKSSPADFSDPEFPARVRARDPGALQDVARAYLRQVFRAARGAGLPSQQAEDVVQATFTTFIETAPRFEGRSHVRTWLFGILYRKIAETRRAGDRDRRMDAIDEVVESRFNAAGSWSRPPEPTESLLHGRQVLEQIKGCLESAPSPQRMAFVLREVEGLETAEICEILAVTHTNLGVMLYRVRNRLRECLEAQGVRSTS